MPTGQDLKVWFYLISPSLKAPLGHSHVRLKKPISYTPALEAIPRLPLAFKGHLAFSKMIKDVGEGKKKTPINQAGEKANINRLRVNGSNIK